MSSYSGRVRLMDNLPALIKLLMSQQKVETDIGG
jgi:uncharacterized protein YeeX (DUF496 family)